MTKKDKEITLSIPSDGNVGEEVYLKFSPMLTREIIGEIAKSQEVLFPINITCEQIGGDND